MMALLQFLVVILVAAAGAGKFSSAIQSVSSKRNDNSKNSDDKNSKNSKSNRDGKHDNSISSNGRVFDFRYPLAGGLAGN